MNQKYLPLLLLLLTCPASPTCPETGDCNINNNSVQTCPSCIDTCTSRCSYNRQCIRHCLTYCSCDRPNPEPSPLPLPSPTPAPAPIIDDDAGENQCCHVLHPRTCFDDDGGNKRCFIRRHKECGSACTSPVVSIQKGGSTRGCQYVRNYPYVYCGNYERQDCGQCYSCNGNWSPQQCSRTSGCSEGCKRTLAYEPLLY